MELTVSKTSVLELASAVAVFKRIYPHSEKISSYRVTEEFV